MDKKGIIGGVLFDGQYIFNWTMFSLPMEHLSQNGSLLFYFILIFIYVFGLEIFSLL